MAEMVRQNRVRAAASGDSRIVISHILSITAGGLSGGVAKKVTWSGILFMSAAFASSPQLALPLPQPASKAPDLPLILQSVEEVQRRNSASSRAYQVTREYKVFHAHDTQPTSELTAQIDFTPPNVETYKITQATGNKMAVKIVRDILDQETEAAKRGPGKEISRINYDEALPS